MSSVEERVPRELASSHANSRGTLSFRKTEQTLAAQIKVLMLMRVVTVTVLLGVTIYLQILEKSSYIEISLVFLYGLCIFSYVLTILYVLVLKTRFSRWYFAYIQLHVDVLFTGTLIYVTNGYDIFSFLFILTIISSSILVGRRGAFFTAVFSGFVFGIVVDLYYFGLIPPISSRYFPLQLEEMRAAIFNNCFAFLSVAFLSGWLSEQLQRTGRKLQEKQSDLQDLENLNWHIVESLASGLITINNEQLMISFNRAAEDLTGLTFAEVFHLPIESVFKGIASNMTGEKKRWEEKYERKRDGKTLVLGFSSSPLRHPEGRLIGRIINFQDVTLLKHMQDRVHESDKWAAIGRMAAGIAHEIRNPLASMSGCIQTLRQDLDPGGEDRVLMDIVIRETDRLNLLVQEFLDFAKPKESRIKRVDLGSVISEVVAVGRQHISQQSKEIDPKQGGIEIQMELEKTPVFVRADTGQLKQIFWNLLLNSVQSIEEVQGNGCGNIFFRLSLAPDKVNQVIFEIRDTGCGIPTQNLGLIFEPFFTTKRKGTGLGLATVRKISEENGWEIEVQSKVSQGTSVTMRFPLIEFAQEDQDMESQRIVQSQ